MKEGGEPGEADVGNARRGVCEMRIVGSTMREWPGLAGSTALKARECQGFWSVRRGYLVVKQSAVVRAPPKCAHARGSTEAQSQVHSREIQRWGFQPKTEEF